MTTDTDPTRPQRPAGPVPALTSRRRVLGIAGAVGAGGILAACGGTDQATPAGTPKETTSSPAPSTPADTGSSTPAGGGGGGPALVKTADVKVGGGVILQGKKIVVTQPVAGEFKAFTAVCTHQGCLVGAVSSGTISCPCHGSRYSAENGSVTGGPAPRPLKEIKVAVEGDSVIEA